MSPLYRGEWQKSPPKHLRLSQKLSIDCVVISLELKHSRASRIAHLIQMLAIQARGLEFKPQCSGKIRWACWYVCLTPGLGKWRQQHLWVSEATHFYLFSYLRLRYPINQSMNKQWMSSAQGHLRLVSSLHTHTFPPGKRLRSKTARLRTLEGL